MRRTLITLTPLLGAMLLVFLMPLVHAVAGVPSTEFEFVVLSYVPTVFVLLWMTADAQHRRCTPCYDFGLLMSLLFPLTLLGYLLWTRGWWGLAVFVGMISLMYGPSVIVDVLRILAAG